MFGVVLLILILLEVVSTFLIYLRWNVFNIRPDFHEKAEAYQGQTWARDFWNESRVSRVRWQPYVDWRTRPFQGKYIRIDSEGLRHTWNEMGSETSRITIFVFGGSTLWGTGARDDYTIPSILSRILSQRHRSKIYVVNFGQVGFQNTQELLTLLLELQAGHRPDVAIFYDGANDAYSALTNGRAGLTSYESKLAEVFNAFNSDNKLDLLKLFVGSGLKKSACYTLGTWLRIFPHVENETPKFEIVSENEKNDLAENVANVYLSNVKILTELSQQRHFNTLFYLQPLLSEKEHRTEYEETQLRHINMSFYSMFYAKLEGSSVSSKMKNFHSLSHLFQNVSQPVFIDAIHVSEAGNERIAQRMAEDIEPILNRALSFEKLQNIPSGSTLR